MHDPLVLSPGQGIGPIRFGMTPAEVRSAFDEPTVYEDWMGGNLNDSLLFHGLIVGFDKCDAEGPLPDSRMRELRLHGRDNILLFGRSLWSWTTADLVQRLSPDSPVVNEHGDINAPRLGLDLQVGARGTVEWAELWKPARGWISWLRRLTSA